MVAQPTLQGSSYEAGNVLRDVFEGDEWAWAWATIFVRLSIRGHLVILFRVY